MTPGIGPFVLPPIVMLPWQVVNYTAIYLTKTLNLYRCFDIADSKRLLVALSPSHAASSHWCKGPLRWVSCVHSTPFSNQV